uniref:Phosphoribosyl-ATP pyrophosphatase n=1 Tax=Magnetococcus massalia (strain MO-1) TaxID=451514 RepID=A0A1S7LI86_MAGMO|nr:Phosphoribosyl-ATP pyrophosphatase[Include Phosphoribosyl-ATP pyrophosphohydrolase domain and PilZ domain] [Candidatus Magnetococcus massalia]
MNDAAPKATSDQILAQVFRVIEQRKKQADPDASYVAKLFDKGDDAILKKVGEEATELVLAIKGRADREEITHEAADLIFHMLVGLSLAEVHPGEVLEVLAKRFGKTGLNRNQGDATEEPPARRKSERRTHSKTLKMHLTSGEILEGITQDISLEGMMIQVDQENRLQLLGEKGYIELTVPNRGNNPARGISIEIPLPPEANSELLSKGYSVRTHRFEFEIVRVTRDGIGLRLMGDSGMFSYALANEVFNDLM